MTRRQFGSKSGFQATTTPTAAGEPLAGIAFFVGITGGRLGPLLRVTVSLLPDYPRLIWFKMRLRERIDLRAFRRVSRLSRVQSGQLKSDDQDHAIRWKSEAGKFRS
jgi:hypothetical protein